MQQAWLANVASWGLATTSFVALAGLLRQNRLFTQDLVRCVALECFSNLPNCVATMLIGPGLQGQ